MSEIKSMFEVSRKENDIGLVVPVLIRSELFVIGKKINESFEFALTKSPKKGEFCVTVSESESLFDFDKWDIKALSGRDLLKKIPENIGVLIAYKDGADYITGKQVVNIYSEISYTNPEPFLI